MKPRPFVTIVMSVVVLLAVTLGWAFLRPAAVPPERLPEPIRITEPSATSSAPGPEGTPPATQPPAPDVVAPPPLGDDDDDGDDNGGDDDDDDDG